MKISKDLDLAARLLLFLAAKTSSGGASKEELARGLDVPVGEVEVLLTKLHESKIVRIRRQSGRDEYLLRHDPSQIRIGMIVDALRPRERWELTLAHDETRSLSTNEEGRPAWDELEKVILRGLQDYTLDHLAWDTTFHLDS